MVPKRVNIPDETEPSLTMAATEFLYLLFLMSQMSSQRLRELVLTVSLEIVAQL